MCDGHGRDAGGRDAVSEDGIGRKGQVLPGRSAGQRVALVRPERREACRADGQLDHGGHRTGPGNGESEAGYRSAGRIAARGGREVNRDGLSLSGRGGALLGRKLVSERGGGAGRRVEARAGTHGRDDSVRWRVPVCREVVFAQVAGGEEAAGSGAGAFGEVYCAAVRHDAVLSGYRDLLRLRSDL